MRDPADNKRARDWQEALAEHERRSNERRQMRGRRWTKRMLARLRRRLGRRQAAEAERWPEVHPRELSE